MSANNKLIGLQLGFVLYLLTFCKAQAALYHVDNNGLFGRIPEVQVELYCDDGLGSGFVACINGPATPGIGPEVVQTAKNFLEVATHEAEFVSDSFSGEVFIEEVFNNTTAFWDSFHWRVQEGAVLTDLFVTPSIDYILSGIFDNGITIFFNDPFGPGETFSFTAVFTVDGAAPILIQETPTIVPIPAALWLFNLGLLGLLGTARYLGSGLKRSA